MPTRQLVRYILTALVACAGAVAGSCRGELTPPHAEGARHELYLTLPVCLGIAMDRNLENRLPELKAAMENEAACAACAESARKTASDLDRGEELDCARVEELIAFALAFAPSTAEEPGSLRKIAGLQLACDVADAYFKTAIAQKCLEDAIPMLETAREDLSVAIEKSHDSSAKDAASDALERLEAEIARKREDFDNARLKLVELMNFHPVTDIRVDSSLLEAMAAQPSSNFEPGALLQGEEQAKCQEAFPELKELFQLSGAAQANARRRDWALLGLKASETLLEARGARPVSRETVTAATLAYTMIAFAGSLDARAAYERAEERRRAEMEVFVAAQAKGASPELALARAGAASWLIERDKALGELCLALETLSISLMPDPSASLAANGKGPEGSGDGPSDPTLVESPSPATTLMTP